MNRPFTYRLTRRTLLSLALPLSIGSSQAAVAVIHIEDNYCQTAKYSQETGTGSTYINAMYQDLTGDGVDDVTIDNDYYHVGLSFQRDVRMGFDLDGTWQLARNDEFSGYYKLGNTDGKRIDVGPVSIGGVRRGVAKVTLEDVRINGGAATEAWLVVQSENPSVLGAHKVSLTQLIFDTESTTVTITPEEALGGGFDEFDPTSVPEPSTSLLVSLAGVGLVLRRKR